MFVQRGILIDKKVNRIINITFQKSLLCLLVLLSSGCIRNGEICRMSVDAEKNEFLIRKAKEFVLSYNKKIEANSLEYDSIRYFPDKTVLISFRYLDAPKNQRGMNGYSVSLDQNGGFLQIHHWR